MLKSLVILSVCASSALGFVAPGSKETARQSTSAGVVSLSGVSRSTSQLEAHKLVLIRHGESEWNDLNIFTGWADAALNEKGLREAAQGGQLLKDAGRHQGWRWTQVRCLRLFEQYSQTIAILSKVLLSICAILACSSVQSKHCG